MVGSSASCSHSAQLRKMVKDLSGFIGEGDPSLHMLACVSELA
jgi:hypothetical protein